MLFFLVISFAMLIIGLHVGVALATLTSHDYQTAAGTYKMNSRRVLTVRDTGCENVWAEVLHVLVSFRMNFWLGRCHGNR
jgi:hypothetical protein